MPNFLSFWHPVRNLEQLQKHAQADEKDSPDAVGFPLRHSETHSAFFCFETSTVNEPPDSGKERLAHMKATQVTDAQGGEQLTFPACHGPTAKHTVWPALTGTTTMTADDSWEILGAHFHRLHSA